MQNRAVGIGAKNDVAEFLGRDQPALRAHRVGELLALRNRLAADLPCRVHVVLCLDCRDDVTRRYAKLGQLVWIHPDAHRILAAEDLHARNTLHAGKLVLKIDDGVIGQEILAQLAAGRIDGHQHQRRRQRFLHGEAGRCHLWRQLRLRLIHAQLRKHLIDVGIRLRVEVDEDLNHSVISADGVHVDHVVDAVHLLLDGSRHCLRKCLGVGAGISRGDKNLRRNNIGNCEMGS